LVTAEITSTTKTTFLILDQDAGSIVYLTGNKTCTIYSRYTYNVVW